MDDIRLTTLIDEEKWPEVLDTISGSDLEEVQAYDSYGFYPIHLACLKKKVPIEVIESLIELHPQSVKQKTEVGGRLPLHCAVTGCEFLDDSSTKINIIKVLLSYYKDAVCVKDKNGRTPLHDYLRPFSSHSMEVTNMLVEANPDVVRMSTTFEYYPLHYAVLHGNWEISEYLIKLYPDALLKKEITTGRTPRDIADYNGEQDLCEKLHEEEKQRLGRNHCIDEGLLLTEEVEMKDSSID